MGGVLKRLERGDHMIDYKALYYALFSSIADAEEHLLADKPDAQLAIQILQQLQKEAEERYLLAEED